MDLKELAEILKQSEQERTKELSEARHTLNSIKDLSDYKSRKTLEDFIRKVVKDEVAKGIIQIDSESVIKETDK